MRKFLSVGFILVLCLFIAACSANNENVTVESEPPADISQVAPSLPPQSQPPAPQEEEEPEQEPELETQAASTPPQPPPQGVRVAAGQYSSFAIQQPSGSLWGWGLFGEMEWGENIPSPAPTSVTPKKIMDDVGWVSAGGWLGLDSPVLAIKSDMSLWAFGNNTHGQFGDGTTISRDEPIRVMDNIAHVSVGAFHTMAIKTDGSLWTWGGNWQGQLGDGTTDDRHVPVKIMDNVIAISAGAGHSMAVTSDLVLWGWGHNGTGRIGYAPTADELNPIHPSPIKIMDDVINVSAGFDHTLVIKNDSSLWAFGNNAMGRLGVGPPIIPSETPWNGTASPSPNPIKILDGVVAIAAGNCDSLAITSDGNLWGWGDIAGWMQMGDYNVDMNTPIERLWELGFERNRLAATPYVIMKNVASVSTWNGHVLASRTDGSVWAFGDNRYAQIGDGGEYGFPEDGSMPSRNSPVLVNFPANR